MRVVDTIWTIGPVFRTGALTIHWLDVAAVLGMGGIWLFFFFTQSRRPRARAGARPVLQGSDGSWRTLAIPIPPPAPTEGDGISYRGVVWFVGVLAVTTILPRC